MILSWKAILDVLIMFFYRDKRLLMVKNHYFFMFFVLILCAKGWRENPVPFFGKRLYFGAARGAAFAAERIPA